MGTLHSLIKQNRCARAVNATAGSPFDEFFDFLSPLLKEPAAVSDVGPRRHGTDNEVLLLLEANARLRALAVQLSNLVGDLPPRPR
jgi:hypothetical protein